MNWPRVAIFMSDACWRVAETARNPNDIPALAGISALTSKAPRLCSCRPRRPASFEVSVKINGVDDRVDNSLFLLWAGAAASLSHRSLQSLCR